jgi:integrase
MKNNMTKLPKYRKLATRDKGFVEHRGKRISLPGKYNSPESLTAYAAFIAKLAKGDDPEPEDFSLRNGDVQIRVLCIKFLDWAKTRYVKHGRSTGSYERFRDSIVPPLIELYGDKTTAEFGPLALKRVRQSLVNSGLSRGEVNRRTWLLRRIFSWGVENELVPAAISEALKYVRALYCGETAAYETHPVTVVPSNVIDATLKYLPPTLADMATIQWLSGCRPSEVCNLRWKDINQSDDIWIYIPWEYKTEHFGRVRKIPLLPDVQAILEKYRHRPPDEFIFSPKETVRLLTEQRHAKRKTSVQPSQVKRHKKVIKNPRRYFREFYQTRAYSHAIRTACAKANVEKWSPNRLRHTFATDTRELLGAEAAQAILGHAQLSTTEIYAEKTLQEIKGAARKLDEAKKKTKH